MNSEYILIKAEFEAYLKQYTVYKVLRDNSRFNYGEESIRLAISDDKEFCMFIYKNEKQIGGVILRSTSIKHLFLKPEHTDLMLSITEFLHSQISQKAQQDRGISCLPSDLFQAAGFEKLGYKTVRKLRCMIGPVRKFSWKAPVGYSFRNPDESDAESITKLFYDANIEEQWHQPVTMEHFAWGTDLYFNKSKTSQLIYASSICFEESTCRAVGACLVSMEEGFPFIFDIHVLKEHRRRGIAAAMMQKAISKVDGEHKYMRLFVIDGNPAEYLYKKLGFITGNPVFIMKYVQGE